MNPTACLINCARGGIIDEDDLYEVLSEKKIHGAGVDVLTQEPFDKDDRIQAKSLNFLLNKSRIY